MLNNRPVASPSLPEPITPREQPTIWKSSSFLRNLSILSLILLLLILLLVFSKATFEEDPEAFRRLGLTSPIEIEGADMYLDGGTLFAVLTDGKGRQQKFRLDGSNADDADNFLSITDLSATKPKPFRCPHGGQEERDTLHILESWTYRNLSLTERVPGIRFLKWPRDPEDFGPYVQDMIERLWLRTR